jgi:hypothetical protein
VAAEALVVDTPLASVPAAVAVAFPLLVVPFPAAGFLA